MRIGTESRQQARRKDPRGCTSDECPEDIVGTAGSGFKDVLKSRNHELVCADVQDAVMNGLMGMPCQWPWYGKG
jgi:hypothetical protein